MLAVRVAAVMQAQGHVVMPTVSNFQVSNLILTTVFALYIHLCLTWSAFDADRPAC